jgi:ABC-type transporter Mla subunit MlaD
VSTPDVKPILADLAVAQRALRQSSNAFDEAMGGLRVLMDSIAAANHAQGAAIDAVIAATDKALALLEGNRQ